jgi:hypothetical protein
MRKRFTFEDLEVIDRGFSNELASVEAVAQELSEAR